MVEVNHSYNQELSIMNTFIEKHRDLITGTISVFDRIIFKGYLPFGYSRSAENFLDNQKLLVKDFSDFVKTQSAKFKNNALALTEVRGCPYEYLKSGGIRKDDRALKIAQRDKITEGLVCVFGITESNSSFALRYGDKRPRLEHSMPRCMTLYFYFIDRELGLMHVRISTWFPYPIQIYINGHEWLARKLKKNNIKFILTDNAFTAIDDCKAAQEIADQFPHQPWDKIFQKYALRVNPLMKTILAGYDYYWVTDQAEYSTDVMFKNKSALNELYLKLQRHVAVCISAEDIMMFLGKKLHSSFGQEISTSISRREPGTRIKHRIGKNWIKMYDKFGFVLRIETVINDPHMFMIRRSGKRKDKEVIGYFPMGKGIANLYRYAEIGMSANNRYLEMLTAVDNPAEGFAAIRRVCEKAKLNGKSKRALNPLQIKDISMFAAVMKGEFALQGFRHKDIAKALGVTLPKNSIEKRRASSNISRKIQLLRAHGLVCMIPRSRRYRTTSMGQKIMAAVLYFREELLPENISKNIA
jgi:hypothetical protein